MARKLPLFVGTLALVLSGCGMSGVDMPSLQVADDATALSQIYSVGGQPQILVKRRLGHLTALPHAGLRRVRASRIAGLEVDAVVNGDVAGTLAELQKDPNVEYAEPNYQYSIPEHAQAAPAATSQDVNFPGEYGPKLTHAEDVFSRTTGQGQVIAIVDTGVDLQHPDLAPKLVTGANMVDTTASAADDQGHGTNCAGIAASLQDDKGGIVGMAPGAKIMPVKVLDAQGSGSDASIAEGIQWAADHGATVISLSLGGPKPTKTGAAAIKYALGKGVVVVAAMGNDGSGNKSYPAAYPGVIAVGATDINDQVTDFSQFGSWISVTAPGYSILSTFPTYKVTAEDEYAQQKDFWESHGMRADLTYGYLTGTSQATPHVAGLAALVRAANPTLGPAQVKARIEGAASQTGGMLGSAFDVHYGHGRIDALHAI